MYGLLLSGLAMQMTGHSRPASGAEHHMAHFWEMAVINDESQTKLQDTMQKIVNDSNGGLVCIII